MSSTSDRSMNSMTQVTRRTVVALCVLALLPAALGCTRAHYRRDADAEVYDLVSDQPPLTQSYTIQPSRASRFFDPFNPDRPPMPPDDPVSPQLMRSVDGKRGYRWWDANGFTPMVASPDWTTYLPCDADGEFELDLRTAIEAGYINSRDFQTELEDLYLSALDVTFERFRFDTMWFNTNSTSITPTGRDRGGSGGESSTIFRNDNQTTANRLFATGGELVAGLANSLVWQFAGNNTYTAFSLLDFALVQPLLRNGSKAVVLERLTRAERALLANVRAMQRFQRGFVTEIATGVDAGGGPSRAGGVFGGSGLQGFTGVGTGGFGGLGGIGGGGGVGGGGFAGGAGAGQAGGFWGLLQQFQELRNLEANIAALRDSLSQLQAAYDAGRIDIFQVDQARQALYNAQSQLVNNRAGYQDSLDSFKLDLGLPPMLNVKINPQPLAPFELIYPDLTELQRDLGDELDRLRDPNRQPAPQVLQARLAASQRLRERTMQELEMVREDFRQLEANRQRRLAALDQLRQRPEFTSGQFDPSAFDSRLLADAIDVLSRDFAALDAEIEASLDGLAQLAVDAPAMPPERALELATDTLARLSSQLLTLSLVQARTRLEKIVLPRVELTNEQAIEIARTYRRDWRNARAALVDTWRLIEFNANALEADLDIVLSGDLGTKGDNLFRFRGTTGQLRAELLFDAPITRLAERNNYRESLIEYQRARRRYMEYEDSVARGLRLELRNVYRNQLNFEFRRAAVRVAIRQVDVTGLRLNQPPRPNAADPQGQQFGATTARDLLSALSDLLNVQNDFLSVWINYEVLRMVLDRDLGTMQLDAAGMWVDPGDLTLESFHVPLPCSLGGEIEEPELIPPGLEELLPAPEAVPQQPQFGPQPEEIIQERMTAVPVSYDVPMRPASQR